LIRSHCVCIKMINVSLCLVYKIMIFTLLDLAHNEFQLGTVPFEEHYIVREPNETLTTVKLNNNEHQAPSPHHLTYRERDRD
jgi:hypothetical protein